MKLIIDIEPRYCKDMQSNIKELYYEAINRITEAVRNGVPYEGQSSDYDKGFNDGYAEALKNLPEYRELSKKFERPQGRWIVKSNGITNHYACDKCGSPGDIQDKFCRECGVAMRGDHKK